MLRLTLAARLAVTGLVGLMAIWLGVVALHHWSLGSALESRPAPQRIAALVELIENADADQRSRALDALNSEQFVVRFLASSGQQSLPEDAVPVSESVRRPYEEALGSRPFVMFTRAATGIARRFPRLFARAAKSAELLVTIDTGEVLLIEARGRSSLSPVGLPFGFGAGLLGTLVALAALVIMHRETRPLVELASALEHVDLDAEGVPLPSTRGRAPEIRALITAFDRLQGRLHTVLTSRMAMLGGISHDVRTFATRLRLRVDHIEDEAERERAAADIDDMIRLLDDALLASRASAGELQEELIEIEPLIEGEVADRIAQGADVAHEVGHALVQPTVLGDRLALKRVVANATENALKYGHAARLRTLVELDEFVIMIDDDGPGIPLDRRQAMLEPFTRMETSRSRGTGGAGLGLAIMRNLVEAHGGTLDIADAPGGGARIVVRLPLFDIAGPQGQGPSA